MSRGLLVDGINEIKRVFGEVPLVRLRIDPDGKKLSTQVTGTSLVQADMAEILGIGAADIEVIVHKTLGCVGVRVYDDGRVMNGTSPGTNRCRLRARLLGQGDSGSCDQEHREKKMILRRQVPESGHELQAKDCIR